MEGLDLDDSGKAFQSQAIDDSGTRAVRDKTWEASSAAKTGCQMSDLYLDGEGQGRAVFIMPFCCPQAEKWRLGRILVAARLRCSMVYGLEFYSNASVNFC